MLSPRPRWAFIAVATAVAAFAAACDSGTGSSPEWAAGQPSVSQSVPPDVASSPGQKCAKPTQPKGWGPLKFSEDFNGKKVDPAKWSVYDSPDASVPRAKERVTVSNGEMKITGGKNAAGKDLSGGLSANINLMYMHVDVCVKFDRGAGYSGIALLWPQTEKWPDDGEIDIAEVNRGAREFMMSYVHNNPTNDRYGHQTHADYTQWHVISADWTPHFVTVYVDGEKQWTAGLDDRTRGMVPTTSPMHLALQLDVGCDGFVECRNDETPDKVVMHTDWVRIYGYKEGAGAPG